MNSNTELRDKEKVNHEDKLNRRELLTKAGCLTLSAATMMILMKSQPAKAASVNQSVMAKPNTDTSATTDWTRTTRN
ncbi:MAG TPA: hypothetical protein VGK38_02630 [Prolixibacteraceae bacterium]|jgi:hypothetical protein